MSTRVCKVKPVILVAGLFRNVDVEFGAGRLRRGKWAPLADAVIKHVQVQGVEGEMKNRESPDGEPSPECPMLVVRLQGVISA